jgi:hypothetical protein
MLGVLIFIVLFHWFASRNAVLALWITIVICSLIIALLSIMFFDHIVIFGAAFGGAYLFVRVSLIKDS